ncbi:flagellar biosynthesis repressor FlbT [Oleisolibacter albus]|uniref:flagellar biosynthesis repressor FlbT n=1 Tax=Oleisolibacter albus TaxID=2171757 RepID=UPI000DF414D5|nr:flagellar biosynthesis repressor FlbT [Oleisolibacter albus]
MPLKIRLKADEHLVINGALLKAVEPTTLLLMNHAKFMLDRQIMRPDQATSPAKRIYFAVQNTYLATAEERPGMLTFLRQCVGDFREATTSAPIRQKLDELERLVGADDFYPALQIARDIMSYEDLILGVGSILGTGAAEDGGPEDVPDTQIPPLR